ncbi:MAG: hypothetical protein OEZ02_12270, partial [Anaerolineae bacterium]|nr:hypothetical protein [Anaerolineae bacterium]
VFAKLVHLSFAVLLVAAVFCMGQRTLGKAGGWLPAAVILGIPIFPIWGSLAYADMGLAVYIFLAVYALTVWQKTLSSGWLVLAGMMTGWALGSKYLAVGMLAAIGLGLLWASRRESGAVILRRSLVFGFPAALIAAPWFLKNAVLGGNPVYPMFFGGAAWPADRLELLNYYLMDSFGSGRGFWDYVTLPWNLYANNIYFATFVSSIEYPSFLFPLALFFPFLRDRKGLGLVGGITLMGFGIWAMGSQQTRFLLSLFAPLSVLTGGVLLGLAGQLRSGLWRRALGSGVLGGFMLVTVIYQGLFFAQINPLPVVAGGESKEDFLTRTVYDYAALRFIQEELPPDARVMMLWDGQGYYCDHRCLPDAEQSQWVGLARRAEFEVGGAAKLLGAGEVSHLLLSLEGLSFFLQHDPSGLHQAAWAFLGDDFLDVCTREIYNDGKMILYALTCD